MADPPPEVVDELYAAPPEEFIALRDAKATELRQQDREAADAVKRLRKPSVSAAAVNRLARDSADDVEALLAAGEALRQAQLGGGGDRAAMRDAARDERDAVERLVGEAGPLSEAALEEVRQTLHAAASDDEARELIRLGVLTEARRAVGFGGFGGAVTPPKSGRRGKPATTRTTTEKKPAAKAKAEAEAEADAADRKRRAAAEAQRQAEAERKRRAKQRVKAARTALRDAERAAGAAKRDRDKAQTALERAEREVERRTKELEAAEDA